MKAVPLPTWRHLYEDISPASTPSEPQTTPHIDAAPFQVVDEVVEGNLLVEETNGPPQDEVVEEEVVVNHVDGELDSRPRCYDCGGPLIDRDPSIECTARQCNKSFHTACIADQQVGLL